MAAEVYLLVVFSVIVWTISTTISSSFVFKPFRDWASHQDKFFAELTTCQHCISHWITFVVVPLIPLRVIYTDSPFLDFFWTSFALIGVSSVIARVLTFLRDYVQAKKDLSTGRGQEPHSYLTRRQLSNLRQPDNLLS